MIAFLLILFAFTNVFDYASRPVGSIHIIIDFLVVTKKLLETTPRFS